MRASPRGAVQAGEHVYLRRPTKRDASRFTALARSSRELLRPWIFTQPETPEEFDEYLRRVRRENADGLLVCRLDDGAMVGVYTISQIVRGPFHSAYLGYYAFAPHRGRGYMGEGLGLVLRHAFDTLNLHRLEANIQPSNTASIELVRRAGFRLEGFSPRYLKVGGRWRDHERWAITVEEWRSGRHRG